MRIITLAQLDDYTREVIAKYEQQVNKRGEKFVGVPQDELYNGLVDIIGDEWMLKKESALKFTKADVNAVANSRFYRTKGLKILLLWAVVVLVLLQAVAWFPVIPIYVYYASCCVATVGFVGLYSKKQRESRLELWRGIQGEIEDEDEDGSTST